MGLQIKCPNYFKAELDEITSQKEDELVCPQCNQEFIKKGTNTVRFK